jgi:hypothetical protein
LLIAGNLRNVRPLVLRWLLPVIAAIALVGSSLTAWAASGIIGDTECCCPVKAKCKCHDHDGKGNPAPTLKRCGGQAKLVTPIAVPAIAAAPPVLVIQQQVSLVTTITSEVIPDDRTLEPETPPF